VPLQKRVEHRYRGVALAQRASHQCSACGERGTSAAINVTSGVIIDACRIKKVVICLPVRPHW
jgi:hypothetical protein